MRPSTNPTGKYRLAAAAVLSVLVLSAITTKLAPSVRPTVSRTLGLIKGGNLQPSEAADTAATTGEGAERNLTGGDTLAVAPSCENGGALDIEALILETMTIVDAKLSATRKNLMAKMLARVAEEELPNDQLRAVWVALLSRESRFNGAAVSSAGAVGIGQLMPKYAKDFGKACGYSDVTEADLRDDHTNARLSACYFRSLVEMYAKSDDDRIRRMALPLGLAAYNAGSASNNVANLKKLTSMAHEPANYLAVIWTTTMLPTSACRAADAKTGIQQDAHRAGNAANGKGATNG